MSLFHTIVADPPWSGIGAGPLCGRMGFGDATGASRPMPYPTMTDDAIAALPVQTITAPNAHLYLWCINAKIPTAYEIAIAWGFKPSTLLVWAKNPMGGGLGGDAFGISTEFILFARRGQLAATSRVSRTWFNWKRPYDSRGKPKHSAKPPEFYQLAESISPGPRCELFARELREGWSSWGDEIESDPTVWSALV